MALDQMANAASRMQERANEQAQKVQQATQMMATASVKIATAGALAGVMGAVSTVGKVASIAVGASMEVGSDASGYASSLKVSTLATETFGKAKSALGAAKDDATALKDYMKNKLAGDA